MTSNNSNLHPDTQYIDSLGGTTEVSKICGLAAASVSEWKKRGIPRPWKLYLETKYPKAFSPSEFKN